MQICIRSLSLIFVAVLASCGGGSEDAKQDGISETRTNTRLASTITTSIATFTGNKANYTIAKTTTGYQVADKVGTSGVTDLSNSVTSIKFADASVNLTVAANARGIATSDLKTLIELYIAFFNRVPDADGLSYWINQFKNGQGIDQIANSFYTAAIQYTTLTGYSSAMTNGDFVKVIYKNVLGRSGTTAPTDDEVNYWANELATNRATKGSLVRTMLGSAHTFTGDATWGWVASLLDNKVSVANAFAIDVGLNYNTPEESITKTMAIAAAVTATNTSTALNIFGGAASSPTPTNTAPIAKAGTAKTVNVGESVSLNGGSSSDADGDVLTYLWSGTRPSGSAATLSSTTTVSTSFKPDVAGTYTITLIVNDGKVSSSPSAVAITAVAAAPVPPPVTTVSHFLYGGSNYATYLGCANCSSFDPESVCNAFGSYGSAFATNSIWNQFGSYGSTFSSYSPWNSFTSTPPKIIGSDGKFYGYFSVNAFVLNRTQVTGYLNVLNYFNNTNNLAATRIYACGS